MKSGRCGTAFFLIAVICAGLSSPFLYAQGRQVGVQTGFDEGGLIAGANFDIVDSPSENYGAYTRLYSKNDAKGAPAVFALGANFRGHYKVGIFDYYLAPGFGLLHYSENRTHLLLGPTLAYGLAADLDKNVALGIENTKIYSWVGQVRGLVKDSFLATIRFNLP